MIYKNVNNKNIRIVLVIIFFFLLFFLYLKYAYLINYDSDKACALIQTKDILDGEFFCNGWYGLTVNGLTTWNVSSLIGLLFKGFNSEAIYFAGAFSYTLLVLIATYLAGRKRDKFSIKNSFITFTGLLFPPTMLYIDYIGVVMHIEAYVYALTVFACIEKYFDSEKVISTFLFVAGGLLLLGNIGDSMFLVFCSVPILITFSIRVIRNIVYGYWNKVSVKELIILIGTIGTILISIIINVLLKKNNIYQWGGYDVKTSTEFMDIPNRMWESIEALFQHFQATVFGVSFKSWLFIAGIPGTIFFLYAVYILIKQCIKIWECDILSQILISSIIFPIVATTLTYFVAGIDRYLMPSVLSLVILTGRENSISSFKIGLLTQKANGIICRMIIMLFILIPLTRIIELPSKPEELSRDRLAEFLLENQLTSGYGNYWTSNALTVAMEGGGNCVPIGYDINTQRLTRITWGNKESDYDLPANYVVINESTDGTLLREDVVSILGNPNKEIGFEEYNILVYNYDISEKIYTYRKEIRAAEG